MNREIRFRAWNVVSNEWVEEGWCIQKHIPWNNSIHSFGCTVYWMDYYDSIDGYEPFWGLLNPARTLKITQYTGLTDISGRAIFEGDIIRATRKWNFHCDRGDIFLVEFRFCSKYNIIL